MQACVIGLGLIGGSMALSLKKNKFVHQVLGVDQNPVHAQKALDLGIADQILPLEKAVKEAKLIILAIPVDKAEGLITTILDQINDQSIVTDLGSTKNGICNAVKNHSKRGRYVASHPIAGTENTGPDAAFDQLFQGKLSIICDAEQSDDDALQKIKSLYQSLEMNLTYMSSQEHDLHLAYVSHLSHITSFALGLTVLEVEKDEKNIFNLAGSGFASTARLAKSSASMWVPILLQNKDHLIRVMSEYIRFMEDFKNGIEEGNPDTLKKLIEQANKIRRILEK